jgi:hypothetical protein
MFAFPTTSAAPAASVFGAPQTNSLFPSGATQFGSTATAPNATAVPVSAPVFSFNPTNSFSMGSNSVETTFQAPGNSNLAPFGTGAAAPFSSPSMPFSSTPAPFVPFGQAVGSIAASSAPQNNFTFGSGFPGTTGISFSVCFDFEFIFCFNFENLAQVQRLLIWVLGLRFQWVHTLLTSPNVKL